MVRVCKAGLLEVRVKSKRVSLLKMDAQVYAPNVGGRTLFISLALVGCGVFSNQIYRSAYHIGVHESTKELEFGVVSHSTLH